MAKKKTKWFLATNTANLNMIIAQGLITTSDGFSKYYRDTLELVPNYIPLFKDEIPNDVLDYVKEEENDLIPVIIEIDIAKISSEIKVKGENSLIDLEGEKEKVNELFLLAPLPLSVISSIIFSSSEAKKEFEENTSLYSNVVLNGLKLSATKADEKLFKQNTLTASKLNELKKIELIEKKVIDYKKVYAYGGLLLNLFYFSKNGNISNDNYYNFLDLDKELEKQDMDVYDFFKNQINKADTIKKKMDYGLIKIALESKDFKEDVVDFLESESWNEKSRVRTQELANKLKAFELGVSNKSISEQFMEARTPLEKILLMLFLREDSEALMEYSLDIFTEQDYLNFAMMFGIRDKFIKIPKALREFDGLQQFISLKMSEYAHRNMGSSMTFKSSSKPLTIMDMFNKNSIKKKVIKELKIENTIETLMPKKDYRHEKGKNTYVGFIEPEYRVLEDKYFTIMSKTSISKVQYNKLAKMK